MRAGSARRSPKPVAVASSLARPRALGWLHIAFHSDSLVGSPHLNICRTRLPYRLHTDAHDLAAATRVGFPGHPPLAPLVYQTVSELEVCRKNFDYLWCWVESRGERWEGLAERIGVRRAYVLASSLASASTQHAGPRATVSFPRQRRSPLREPSAATRPLYVSAKSSTRNRWPLFGVFGVEVRRCV